MDLSGLDVLIDPNCPPGTVYAYNPKTVGTLAEYPEVVARAIAEGVDPIVVAPNRRVAKRVAEAVRGVARVDL